MQDLPKNEDNKIDVTQLILDPPRHLLAALTILPRGAMNDIAMAETIQKLGRDNAWKKETPFEHYLTNLYTLSRSKGGALLDAYTRVAQTEVESEASAGAPQVGRRAIM